MLMPLGCKELASEPCTQEQRESELSGSEACDIHFPNSRGQRFMYWNIINAYLMTCCIRPGIPQF
jgi:hypothetical protein